MRLIDADALLPLFIEKAYTMKDRHGVKPGEEWLLNYNDINDVIDNAPTIETGYDLYREETCERKTHCYDYEYWHCIGCNGCKRREAEND